MPVSQELNDIADLFAGADGGAGFAVIRAKLLVLEKQAKQGDAKAAELIGIVHKFYRLTTVLQK